MVRRKFKFKNFVTEITDIFTFYKNNLLYQADFFISEYFNTLKIRPLSKFAALNQVLEDYDAQDGGELNAHKEQVLGWAMLVALLPSRRKRFIVRNLFTHN